MDTQVDEDLILILKNRDISPVIRLKGWEYFLGLTASSEGIRKILIFKKYIDTLLSTIQDTKTAINADVEILNLAHKCLINISCDAEGALTLINQSVDLPSLLLKSICNPKCLFVEPSCYVLHNLSVQCDLLQNGTLPGVLRDLWRSCLRSCFDSVDGVERGRYKFLALFFANIARHPEGRKLIIEDECFIGTFLERQHPTDLVERRLGTAFVLRNCCCDIRYHSKLAELNVLPSLLLPLMGPEEFEEEDMEKFPVECQYLEESKQREEIPAIRRALVQALALLCYTEEGWNLIKSKGVYYVIRELDLWEKDPDVSEAIETLIGYLLVENYTRPDSDSSAVIPAETDILMDIPDFVLHG